MLDDIANKQLNYPKAFIEHSGIMDDVCNNIDG